MAGRVFIARVEVAPAEGSPFTIPDLPRHAALREADAGDFVFAVTVDDRSPDRRVIAARCELDAPARLDESVLVFSGRTRIEAPPRPFPLADAHRFLHDGTRGPADLPGADDGARIDAALARTRAFLDPANRASVPKIAQFWRWLGGGA